MTKTKKAERYVLNKLRLQPTVNRTKLKESAPTDIRQSLGFAFWNLFKRGEIERVDRGTYQSSRT